MENFLYKCAVCETARFSVVDKDEVWCTDCGGCKGLQFHHKIVIQINQGPWGSIGNIFYCVMDKEVMDDSKEK